MDLTLNNLQRLICHKTQPTNQSNTELNHNSCELFLADLMVVRDESSPFYVMNILYIKTSNPYTDQIY